MISNISKLTDELIANIDNISKVSPSEKTANEKKVIEIDNEIYEILAIMNLSLTLCAKITISLDRPFNHFSLILLFFIL